MFNILLSDLVIWISILMGSCCSNVISLEKYLLINNTTYLLTFVQFLIVTLESFIKLPDKSHFRIPYHRHVVSVVLYFTTSTLNNQVFHYNVTIPVHIIVKSMGTCFNMIIGFALYGKRYSYGKVLSNIIVVIGVCTVTLSKSQSSDTTFTPSGQLLIGVLILIFSMITASLLGLYTEVTFARYGRHWEENLFVIHLASLPMFLIGYKQLQLEFNDLKLNYNPMLLRLLLINCTSQLVCVKSVNKLASQMSSLSLNLILLLRKFASLLISLLFITRESFNTIEILGCCLVFVGLLLYLCMNSRDPKLSESENHKEKERKEKNKKKNLTQEKRNSEEKTP